LPASSATCRPALACPNKLGCHNLGYGLGGWSCTVFALVHPEVSRCLSGCLISDCFVPSSKLMCNRCAVTTTCCWLTAACCAVSPFAATHILVAVLTVTGLHDCKRRIAGQHTYTLLTSFTTALLTLPQLANHSRVPSDMLHPHLTSQLPSHLYTAGCSAAAAAGAAGAASAPSGTLTAL
jgi:hypothetical protein